MKKFGQIVFALLWLFSVTGCIDDNDDQPPRYLELGKTAEDQYDVPVVITDSETVLRIEEYAGDFDFEESERVLIKYEITGEQDREERDDQNTDSEGDYTVKALSIQEVVTKQVVELNEENRDTIGSDPLFVNDIWLGGGYLNIDFSFYGDEKVHYINVVKDPDEQPEEETEIHLEIRHDARGDDFRQRYRGLMSFYLDSLEVEGANSVKLVFENQDHYSTPFPGFEIEYEY
ncbi:MAG: hypothetical protein ACOC1E_01160 [Marinilabiliaceae bacterium]